MCLPFILPNSQRKQNISGSPTDVTGSTTSRILINSFSLEESLQGSLELFLQTTVETPGGNKKIYMQEFFPVSPQFLVLMVSTTCLCWVATGLNTTQFLQQEQPIPNANRTGLCTSDCVGVFVHCAATGTSCPPTLTKTTRNTCVTLNSSANIIQGKKIRPTCTVEMLIKFQHPDSDYSFFLGALLEKN